MRTDVLIVVDNARRDLLPSRLLQKEFKEKGVSVDLCSRRNLIIHCLESQPKAVILPRGDWPETQKLAESANVYIVPSEGARLTPETMMSVFLGRTHSGSGQKVQLDQHFRAIKSFDFIKRAFLWGGQTERFLLDSGFLGQDQLKVVGNGRLDIYRNRLSQARQPGGKLKVGVAFSVKTTSIFSGQLQYAKLLYGLNPKERLPMVPEGAHWEDFAWRDFAILRHMMWLLKEVLETTDYELNLRIGPFENIEDYRFLEERYPNRVSIQERDGQLIDFLESIDVLLTCWSTTGLEALLLNKPVVAIPFLIERDRLIYHVEPKANGFDTFLRCYHTPETREEVLEMLDRARQGDLPVSSDPEFLSEFLRSVYNWPSQESVSHQIVSEIKRDLEEPQSGRKSFWEVFDSGAIAKVMGLPFVPMGPKVEAARSLKAVKNFVEDYKSGDFHSNRGFHQIRNKRVEEIVSETQL